MIPQFNSKGSLPPGLHEATWDLIQRRFGHNEHRRKLLVGFKEAMDNLRSAGCRKAFLDGSFVTNKEVPKDWDGCWEIDGVNLDLVDRVIIDADFFPDRMRERFLGDLFLNSPRLPGGNFLNLFQHDRDGLRKGIVSINLETWE